MTKKVIKKEVEVKAEAKVETKTEANLIKVLDRITKERLVIDANKEKDYKTKYLHIGWEEFIK